MVDEYRNRFKKVFDPLCPSEKTSELIMSYMYSMAVTALARANPDDKVLQDERASCMTISPMMDMSLEKAIRDMLVFSSHNILIDTMEETFKSIKNIAEINYRKPGQEAVQGSSTSTSPLVFMSDENSADFDEIDLDSIPKVDTSLLRKAVQEAVEAASVSTPSKKEKRESNEFIGDFDMDFEGINSQVPILTQKQSETEEEDNSPDRLDASKFTSVSYDKVPQIDTDLDY